MKLRSALPRILTGLGGLMVAVALAGALVLHIKRAGDQSMARSDVAFDKGDLRTAVGFAREAALFDAPFLEIPSRARGRLEAIATGAEGSGQVAVAQLAWGALLAAESEGWRLGGPSPRQRRAEERLKALASTEASSLRGPRAPVPGGPVGAVPSKTRRLCWGLGTLLLLGASALAWGRRRPPEVARSWRWAAALGVAGALFWAIGGWIR